MSEGGYWRVCGPWIQTSCGWAAVCGNGGSRGCNWSSRNSRRCSSPASGTARPRGSFGLAWDSSALQGCPGRKDDSHSQPNHLHLRRTLSPYIYNNLTFLRYQDRALPSCRPGPLCVQRRRKSDGGCAWSVSSWAAPCQRTPRARLSLPPCYSPRMDTPRGWCSHHSRLRNKPAPHLAGEDRTGQYPAVILSSHTKHVVRSRALHFTF